MAGLLEGLTGSIHLLSNIKISVVGDRAKFGAYVYRVMPSLAGEHGQVGGVLFTDAEKTAEGWRLNDLKLFLLWEKGQPAMEDPLDSRPEVRHMMRRLWADEDQREIGTEREEALELLWTYTWSLDFNDLAQNTVCFAEDVDVVVTLDTVTRYCGRSDWVKAIMANRSRQILTMHYVSSMDVAPHIGGGRVDIKTYTMTRRRAPGEPGQVLVAGGHYFVTAACQPSGRWAFETFSFLRTHDAMP